MRQTNYDAVVRCTNLFYSFFLVLCKLAVLPILSTVFTEVSSILNAAMLSAVLWSANLDEVF